MDNIAFLTRKDIYEIAQQTLASVNAKIEKSLAEVRQRLPAYIAYQSQYGSQKTDSGARTNEESFGEFLSQHHIPTPWANFQPPEPAVPKESSWIKWPIALWKAEVENQKRKAGYESAWRDRNIFLNSADHAWRKVLDEDFHIRKQLQSFIKGFTWKADSQEERFPLYEQEMSALQGEKTSYAYTLQDVRQLLTDPEKLTQRIRSIFYQEYHDRDANEPPVIDKTNEDQTPRHEVLTASVLRNVKILLDLTIEMKQRTGSQSAVQLLVENVLEHMKILKRDGAGHLLIPKDEKTGVAQILGKMYSDLIRNLSRHFPKASARLDDFRPAAFARGLLTHLERHPYAVGQMKQELLDIVALDYLARSDKQSFLLDDDGMKTVQTRAAELAAANVRGAPSKLVEKIIDNIGWEIKHKISAEMFPKGAHNIEEWEAIAEAGRQRLQARLSSDRVSWSHYEDHAIAIIDDAISSSSAFSGQNVLSLRFDCYRKVGHFNEDALIREHKARLVYLAGKLMGEFRAVLDAANDAYLQETFKEPTDLAQKTRTHKLELFHAVVDTYRHLYGLPSHTTHYILSSEGSRASYSRRFENGQTVNQYRISGIEDMSVEQIAQTAAHEATHEFQRERKEHGGNIQLPPIEQISAMAVPRSTYMTIEKSEAKPPGAIAVKSSSEKEIKVSSNSEMAEAVTISKDLQRFLYTRSAIEREAYAVMDFLAAQLAKINAKERKEEPDLAAALTRHERSLRARANEQWRPDREPERFIGPPTNFLRATEKLLL